MLIFFSLVKMAVKLCEYIHVSYVDLVDLYIFPLFLQKGHNFCVFSSLLPYSTKFFKYGVYS